MRMLNSGRGRAAERRSAALAGSQNAARNPSAAEAFWPGPRCRSAAVNSRRRRLAALAARNRALARRCSLSALAAPGRRSAGPKPTARQQE